MATILIVDDEVSVREYLACVLGLAGHRILEAGDGAEGLHRAQREHPDLVISDILMPALSGFEFVRQMRADPVTACTPVIFMTGVFHEEEGRRLAAECGVHQLLAKPIDRAEIMRIVGNVLTVPSCHSALAEDMGRNHLELLTNTLVAKVRELETVKRGIDQQMAELKRAQQALAELRESRERVQSRARNLHAVQEEERARLARALHDGIAQTLTTLAFAFEAGVGETPEFGTTKIDKMRGWLEQGIRQARELANELRPAVLDRLGLLSAVLWLIERFEAEEKLRIHFRHDGLAVRFAPAVETVAYRLVEEALTNVVRHAKVNEVALRIWVQDGVLNVQVEDEGIGFEQEAAAALTRHAGLSSIREQVDVLGGTLNIGAGPGEGVSLLAQLPAQS
jgi:signal transduction histidine kinase